jgi:hypothetical protein
MTAVRGLGKACFSRCEPSLTQHTVVAFLLIELSLFEAATQRTSNRGPGKGRGPIFVIEHKYLGGSEAPHNAASHVAVTTVKSRVL